MLTIATAGHIDHGKSSLIHALTNIDPDRLPEEKQRGMTIDLGFAWLDLPSGETVGLVDVPGHKHFIRNVIPGLTGIDAVLVVVAADDGWMPQTEEHIQIIDLLGIKNGIIALTKVDLVDDPEWLELVEKDIGARLETTSLKGAPVIRVSSKSGQGIEELKQAISKMAAEIAARRDIGKPFLPVDRVFTIKGSGVVVTGTLSGGSFAPGDDVMIMPRRLEGHIRAAESYKERSGKALPGSRVALNLSGVKKDELARGDVIFAAGQAPASSQIIDTEIRLLPGFENPLKNDSEVMIYLGTAELLARVRLLGLKTLPPGKSALAQLLLSEPAVPLIGQRFIIRGQSPPQTIGGGAVLDPLAPRHKLKDTDAALAFLKKRHSLGLDGLLLSEVGKKGYAEKKELLLASYFAAAEVAAALSRQAGEGKLLEADSLVIDAAWWQGQLETVLKTLAEEHARFPLKTGLSQAELQSRLGLPRPVFNRLISQLVSDGKIARHDDVIALVEHKPRLSAQQEETAGRILAVFKKSGASPPDRKELLEQFPGAEGIMRYLLEQVRLVELPQGILLESGHYGEVRRRIIDFLKEKGAISIQDMSAIFSFSRKYSIPILTQLDTEGITRRQENVRVPARKLE